MSKDVVFTEPEKPKETPLENKSPKVEPPKEAPDPPRNRKGIELVELTIHPSEDGEDIGIVELADPHAEPTSAKKLRIPRNQLVKIPKACLAQLGELGPYKDVYEEVPTGAIDRWGKPVMETRRRIVLKYPYTLAQ